MDSEQSTERDPGTAGTFSEAETTITAIQEMLLSTWETGARDTDMVGTSGKKKRQWQDVRGALRLCQTQGGFVGEGREGRLAQTARCRQAP